MEFADLPFEELLDTIAAETPAPGGGSVAAFATEMAASLTAMAARFARGHWDGSAGAVAQAETLRHRAAPLAGADAEAYENVLTAMRMPADLEAEVRDALIGETLSRAADVPLAIAECAADVAELAAEVATSGNPNLRGDAAAASILAASAVRVAGNLVEINLATTADDPRIARAHALGKAAERAAQRATGDAT
ncbi:MAG TPA: cyclodeaminase/cyclohydrolase family protein [Gaiellaceae bacterium]|nr:cyclodeaminase/cyclohydrolase family protein [Gaiellaceae bacterium]